MVKRWVVKRWVIKKDLQLGMGLGQFLEGLVPLLLQPTDHLLSISWVCVCVCVSERERDVEGKRERERERGREGGQRQRKRERERGGPVRRRFQAEVAKGSVCHLRVPRQLNNGSKAKS